MKKSSKQFFTLFRVVYIWIGLVLVSTNVQAQDGTTYEDEYAALLSRMVEKGYSTYQGNDFLDPVSYWQDLWDRASATDTWTQLMDNAVLKSATTTEWDQTHGTVYALLTISDRVAWVAFPGVSTDKNMETGMRSEHRLMDGFTTIDVHYYFYQEYKGIRDQVVSWLDNHSKDFDKVIVTGHSKGGVLGQYFLADQLDNYPDKVFHFVAFGSPNGGNEDFVGYLSSKSNLLRAHFYTTQGTYTKFTGKVTVYDMITYEEISINDMYEDGNPFQLNYYYPRGLSRKDDFYLTELSDKLERQRLTVSGSTWTTDLKWQQYALKIHDDSYYLSGLQSAYNNGEIEPVLPGDLGQSGQRILFAKKNSKCMDIKNGTVANGTNIQIYDCNTNKAQYWFPFGSTLKKADDLDYCLDLTSSNTANGTNIQFWECNGSNAQKWIYDVNNQFIRSRVNGNKCIALTNGITTNSNNIQLYDCKYNQYQPNQQWEIDGVTSSMREGEQLRIHFAKDPSKCLDFQNAGTANGTNVMLYNCHYTNSQYLKFDGEQIKMWSSGKCVDVKSGSTSNGANVQLYSCNNSDAQQWIYDGLTHTFRFKKDMSKCLDVKGGSTNNSTNIQLWTCNDSDAQKWYFYK